MCYGTTPLRLMGPRFAEVPPWLPDFSDKKDEPHSYAFPSRFFAPILLCVAFPSLPLTLGSNLTRPGL
jgi:hypothetical protein